MILLQFSAPDYAQFAPSKPLVFDERQRRQPQVAPRTHAASASSRRRLHSNKNEEAAKAKGVKRVFVPNRSTKSAERKREQKKRRFRNGQKWRTVCEGRISVAKHRHGLNAVATEVKTE